MGADWQFMEGDMVKIQIYNDPNSAHPMQHPIHFHGQRFVLLSRDGKPNDNESGDFYIRSNEIINTPSLSTSLVRTGIFYD